MRELENIGVEFSIAIEYTKQTRYTSEMCTQVGCAIWYTQSKNSCRNVGNRIIRR